MLNPSTSVGLRYGHPGLNATRLFLAAGLDHFRLKATPSRLGSARGFADGPHRLRAWHLHDRSQADLPCCVTPSLIPGGSGMLTGYPSPTPYGLGLGPTIPRWMDLPSETLDLRRTRFSRVLRYSCLHSRFGPLQPFLRSTFVANRTLPYCPNPPQGVETHGFGAELEPRYIIRAGPLDQ